VTYPRIPSIPPLPRQQERERHARHDVVYVVDNASAAGRTLHLLSNLSSCTSSTTSGCGVGATPLSQRLLHVAARFLPRFFCRAVAVRALPRRSHGDVSRCSATRLTVGLIRIHKRDGKCGALRFPISSDPGTLSAHCSCTSSVSFCGVAALHLSASPRHVAENVPPARRAESRR
jgi:hypothetical protein